MARFQFKVTPWPVEQPLRSEAVVARMQAEGLDYYQWSNGPGDVYGVHDHNYHKVLYVVTGSIVFNLPDSGRAVSLNAGDRLTLPSGTAHGAVVGPDGVVCLEAHRQVNGDD